MCDACSVSRLPKSTNVTSYLGVAPLMTCSESQNSTSSFAPKYQTTCLVDDCTVPLAVVAKLGEA